MTRKERARLERERARVSAIGGEGLAIAVADDFLCDGCGGPFGTLYEAEKGKLICKACLPFEWKHGRFSNRIIRICYSGLEIKAKRAEIASP
jgi:hypothetical protein